MANISPADARRLDQLKLRWREIRMEKLQRQLDNAALGFAEQCAQAYEELYGGDLLVISSEYIHEKYSGYEMRFRSKEFLSEERLISFQGVFADNLNQTMDFKILSNNEFEMFVMTD